MIYRKLDASGDYVFGGNKNNYASGVEAVRQAILTRLRLLLGEWWEDLEDGLPLWQNIIAGRNIDLAAKIINERVQRTKHVKSVTNLEVDWDNENRKLTFRATVDTEFGQIAIAEGVA